MKKLSLIGLVLVLFASSCKKKEVDACISASKTTVLVGEVIEFSNCTEDYLEKEWDFGDGEAGNTDVNNPTHKYSEAGQYTVRLYVTNDKGSVDEETLTITVEELFFKSITVTDLDYSQQ